MINNTWINDGWTIEHPKLGGAWCGRDAWKIMGSKLLAEGWIVKMAPPGRKKKTVSAEGQAIINAIDFVSDCLGDDLPYNHLRIQDKMIYATNGQLSAGHPIEEEFNTCPHAERLRVAIAKCGLKLTIAETAKGGLSVSGEKLNAVVPCLAFPDMPAISPDPNQGPASDVLKEAFKTCGVLASEAGSEVIKASLLLEAYTCTGTNVHSMLQFAHGLNLPPAMVIPKVFAATVARKSQKIVGLGVSWQQVENKENFDDPHVVPWIVSSVTFHFEGGGWIKSQCYADRWPDIASILNKPNTCTDVPPGLLDAIETVMTFSDEASVYLGSNKVQSHQSAEVGAVAEINGLQTPHKFNGKLVKQLVPFIQQIDLTTYPDRLFFTGYVDSQPVRGCIMGMTL